MYFAQRCVLAFLTLLSAVSYAEPVPVYQIDNAPGSFLQVTVDHDIYRYSASPQLSDLIVTDAQGNKLPHRITPLKSQHSPAQPQYFSLGFFPVAVGAAPETLLALSSASIRLDDNEISVSVEKSSKPHLQDKSAPIDFFIVDLTDFRARVDALKIGWDVNESNQYLEVEASGTNDLTNWNHIARATLVQLQKEGESLVRDAIPLHLTEMQYAYLRLKFIRVDARFSPTRVEVLNSNVAKQPSALDRWEISGELAEKQTTASHGSASIKNSKVAAWEFTRDDIAPVNRIGLHLDEIMYGDEVRIYSRPDKKQDWKIVHQGILFNIQVGDEWQHSDDIQAHNNSDLYWRIELNESVRNMAQPRLLFSRAPETVQFIANNAAPYNISIETDPTAQKSETNAQIFSQLVVGKSVDWTEVGFKKLEPDINKFARHGLAFSWRTLLFWSILLIALGLLITMALRLMKQVNKDATTSTNP